MEKLSAEKKKIKPGDLVVIKIGSRLLADKEGSLNEARLESLCEQIASFKKSTHAKIILVSSLAFADIDSILCISGRSNLAFN